MWWLAAASRETILLDLKAQGCHVQKDQPRVGLSSRLLESLADVLVNFREAIADLGSDREALTLKTAQDVGFAFTNIPDADRAGPQAPGELVGVRSRSRGGAERCQRRAGSVTCPSRSRPSCKTRVRPTWPPCWRPRTPDGPEGLLEAAAGRVAHGGDHRRDRPPLRHQARHAGRRESPRTPAPPPRPRPR
jgi:hypothetical protein